MSEKVPVSVVLMCFSLFVSHQGNLEYYNLAQVDFSVAAFYQNFIRSSKLAESRDCVFVLLDKLKTGFDSIICGLTIHHSERSVSWVCLN